MGVKFSSPCKSIKFLLNISIKFSYWTYFCLVIVSFIRYKKKILFHFKNEDLVERFLCKYIFLCIYFFFVLLFKNKALTAAIPNVDNYEKYIYE